MTVAPDSAGYDPYDYESEANSVVGTDTERLARIEQIADWCDTPRWRRAWDVFVYEVSQSLRDYVRYRFDVVRYLAWKLSPAWVRRVLRFRHYAIKPWLLRK